MDLLWLAGHFATFHAGRNVIRATFGLLYETNPPTWWSAALLGMVGVLCVALACRPWASHPLVSDLKPIFIATGAFYIYASMDEAGVVHERVSQAMKLEYGPAGERWYIPNLTTFPLWILLWAAAIAVLVLAVMYLPRLFKRFPVETSLVVGGLALFFVGAAFFELLFKALRIVNGDVLNIETGVEETLEMIGTTLAFYGVARIFARVAGELFPKAAEVEPLHGHDSGAGIRGRGRG